MDINASSSGWLAALIHLVLSWGFCGSFTIQISRAVSVCFLYPVLAP